MTTVVSLPEGQAHVPIEQRFVLPAVDWATYQKISDALAGRHVRLTYDGDNLEFMTISPIHARYSRLICRMIVVLTEEMGLPIASFGDMTCDRQDVRKGLEPDECFYLGNEPRIRDRETIDLSSDPPPDLAVEVEVTRSSRDRMDIYAKLRVPEVWRFDGQSLRISQLDPNGNYVATNQSLHFPNIPLSELTSFVQRRTEMDENSLLRSFRAWVQQTLRS